MCRPFRAFLRILYFILIFFYLLDVHSFYRASDVFGVVLARRSLLSKVKSTGLIWVIHLELLFYEFWNNILNSMQVGYIILEFDVSYTYSGRFFLLHCLSFH